jgi:hypothetical protein
MLFTTSSKTSDLGRPSGPLSGAMSAIPTTKSAIARRSTPRSSRPATPTCSVCAGWLRRRFRLPRFRRSRWSMIS